MLARGRARPSGPNRLKVEFDKELYLEGHPHYIGIQNLKAIKPIAYEKTQSAIRAQLIGGSQIYHKKRILDLKGNLKIRPGPEYD